MAPKSYINADPCVSSGPFKGRRLSSLDRTELTNFIANYVPRSQKGADLYASAQRLLAQGEPNVHGNPAMDEPGPCAIVPWKPKNKMGARSAGNDIGEYYKWMWNLYTGARRLYLQLPGGKVSKRVYRALGAAALLGLALICAFPEQVGRITAKLQLNVGARMGNSADLILKGYCGVFYNGFWSFWGWCLDALENLVDPLPTAPDTVPTAGKNATTELVAQPATSWLRSYTSGLERAGLIFAAGYITHWVR